MKQSDPVDNKEMETIAILKVYDPAMCCSSGVCGPSVDPVLVRFANVLDFISNHSNIHVERYNLGQQPQAFVDNPQVKSLLAEGGDTNLPFIFVNDKLIFQDRYPSRGEILYILGIDARPAAPLSPAFPIYTGNGTGGGC